MDFQTFIAKKDEIEVGLKAGLYCVMQNHLPAEYQAFRCGLAGKPVDSATQFKSAEGNFASRFAQYLNYWLPTSAKVFACLTVPRRAQMGFAERVMPPADDRDGREPYARLHLGKTLIQIREAQYHQILMRLGMKRLGMRNTPEERKRSEFFKGKLQTCIRALREIGTGELYIFHGDSVDQIEKITLKKRGIEAVTPEQVALRSNPSREQDDNDGFSATELDDDEELQDPTNSTADPDPATRAAADDDPDDLPLTSRLDFIADSASAEVNDPDDLPLTSRLDFTANTTEVDDPDDLPLTSRLDFTADTPTVDQIINEPAAARAVDKLRNVVPRRSSRLSGEAPLYFVTDTRQTIERLAKKDPRLRQAVEALQQVRRVNPGTLGSG